MEKYDEKDGVWRTVGGRRIFIKNGQDLASAMKESGKFKSASKKGTPKKKKVSEMSPDEFDKQAELEKKVAETKEKFKKGEPLTKDENETGKYDDNYRGDDYWDLSEEYQNGEYSEEEIAEELKNMYKTEKGVKKAYEEITGRTYGEKVNRLVDQNDLTNPTDQERAERQRMIDELRHQMPTQEYTDYVYSMSKENITNDQIREKLDKYKNPELHALYAQYLHDKEGKSWEKISELEENQGDFNKSMLDWSETKQKQDYEKENDSETMKRYQGRVKELEEELKGNLDSSDRKSKEEQINNLTGYIEELNKKYGNKNKYDVKYSSVEEALSDPNHPTRQYLDKKAQEKEARYKHYSADDRDILDRFGEDYGYDEGDNLANLKGQIDYMRNPNESINQTAKRLVEGGDFLIYNEEVKQWLKDRKISYNEDNFWDKYKQEMSERIEKLYNDASSNNQITSSLRQKAYNKYMKEHPGSKMSFEDFLKKQ